QALSGHKDGSVRLWNLEDMKEIRRLQRHRMSVTAVAFAADSRTACSGSLDGTVRRWDTTTGRQLGIVRSEAAMSSLAVSQDGLSVVDGVVRRWVWPTAR